MFFSSLSLVKFAVFMFSVLINKIKEGFFAINVARLRFNLTRRWMEDRVIVAIE